MKTKFSIASLALAGGIFVAALSAGSASACPFAKGQGVLGKKLVNPDLAKLGIVAIAGAGTLTAAGIMAYRSRKGNSGTNPEAVSVPEAFSIPVPPAALEPVAVEEEIESSTRS